MTYVTSYWLQIQLVIVKTRAPALRAVLSEGVIHSSTDGKAGARMGNGAVGY